MNPPASVKVMLDALWAAVFKRANNDLDDDAPAVLLASLGVGRASRVARVEHASCDEAVAGEDMDGFGRRVAVGALQSRGAMSLRAREKGAVERWEVRAVCAQ